MIDLSKKIIELIELSRNFIIRTTNTTMIYTNFVIGKMIVEEFQGGAEKAGYGKNLLKIVSLELSENLGRGFSVDNLENMRKFFLAYSEQFQISENSSRILENKLISETVSRKFPSQFLNWSQYVLLSRIDDVQERKFYEIEALASNWSYRELERQFNSSLYERLLLSKDKDKVMHLSQSGQIVEKPTDIIKDPLILVFLGLDEKPTYNETDLESAIINEIEKFMLELGQGFFFGGRQVRFSFGTDHFYVDLVFYNRFLKCFVLIDLKIGKLKHQDIGQMQMYINYYDRFIKTDDENPTIGIIICKDVNEAIVEITLPQENRQLFEAKYQTFLPSKESLKQLVENKQIRN